MLNLAPVLKWAGGKRWLVGREASEFVPLEFERLVEPFAGGAAVFFHLAPKRAWLNDINADLIDTYRALAGEWEAVVQRLGHHQKRHGSSYYYEVRSSRPRSLAGRAAKFLYLNRTCFNGLYRVNLKGEFNVPVGTKSAVLLDEDDFPEVSVRLRRTKLTSWDFEKVINRVGRGDFVFADPPYTVRHNLNGFIKYNEKLFSWADQERLREALFRAKSRGAQVVLSNADHESIRELYRGAVDIRAVARRSVMAAQSYDRKLTTELLIRV